MLGKVLTLILILLLACLAWAAVAHLRKKGTSCGGICAGCSMRDGCANAKQPDSDSKTGIKDKENSIDNQL